MNTIKKLIVIGALIAVFALGALVDFLISLTYDIEFISIRRQGDPVYTDDGSLLEEDIGVADGETYVEFVVRVTQGGAPRKNHTLYIKTHRNVVGRVVTDEDGYARFDYRCYRAGTTAKAEPVTVTVRDENNSLFIFVPAERSYDLEMYKPSQSDGDGMTTDDIFYDI